MLNPSRRQAPTFARGCTHASRRYLALLLATPLLAVAASDTTRPFDIPAGEAIDTLKRAARQGGVEIVFLADAVRGVRTPAVQGEFRPIDVLRRMVADTALAVAEDAQTGTLMVSRVDASRPTPDPVVPAQPNSQLPSTRMKRKNPLSRLTTWLGLSVLAAPTLLSAAESLPTGSIEGRVLHVTNGSYLHNARITVKPTGTIGFTNEFGEYRIENVPAGQATVTVTYTGLPEKSDLVAVAAGQSVKLDFKLAPLKSNEAGDAVVLDAFVVGASRERNARAIALNEQRFATNIKNVVSTDEFGDLGNSSIGDFVKFLPGVIVDGEEVSVRGMPSHTVPVTVDGNRIATQFLEESIQRGSALDGVALNNIARVEVSKSPTPDSPADSLGGAVNLVSKRAFERATPLLRYHTYVTGTTEHLTLGRVPGPNPQTSGRRLRPGLDFTYIAPINDRFGFTFTGVAFDQLETSHQLRQDWVPHGLGRVGGSGANPYLARFEIYNRQTYRARASFGTTIDWKLSAQDVLTVGAQYTFSKMDQVGNSHIGDVGGQNNLAPASYGPTFTQGAANGGTQQYAGGSRLSSITTVLTSATYRHDGPVWQFEAGGNFSRASGRFRDTDYGYFFGTTFRLERATVRYDEFEYDHPRRIAVQNSAGVTVDPYNIADYRILTSTTSPKDELDFTYGGKAHARRRLDLVVPVTMKIGIDWREQIRDIRGYAPRWDFVGPDRVAGTADDLAGRYDLAETEYSDGANVSGIETVQWPSRFKMYQLFKQHPEYFNFNEVGTLTASTASSRKIVETVQAAYLRLDSRLIDNRLNLVGGVRFEHTNDYGEGQLNDIRATYQQDANGKLILDAAGRPIRISTDAAVRARVQFKERGATAERSYDDFFPSLNASFALKENLIARAAYAKTFGRPNFLSIIPTLAVADPTAADRIITAGNPGLKPWTGHNYDLSLEYYFDRGGLVSAGVFRKDLSDFFGQTRSVATSDQLADYGLTDEFLNYDIVTMTNVGDARVDGIELNYRQELTFLPSWARGLQIHANTTHLDLTGSNTADFDSFVKTSYNWGIGFTRSRFNVSLNWHKRNRQQGGLFTNNNAPPDTYQYTSPSQRLDLNFACRLTRRLSVYGVLRNVTGTDALQRGGEIFSSVTPEYARLRIRREAPTSLNFGLKGEF